MSAHSTSILPAPVRLAPAEHPPALAQRWCAVHDAARVVAKLAGEQSAAQHWLEDALPAGLSECEHWRRERLETGIADLAAILEPGLAALLTLAARGIDGRAAAAALWHEFCGSREALLALLPCGEPTDPAQGS